MDIINTGVSATNTEKINQIAELVHDINKEFHDKIGQGVKFMNLYEFILKKAEDGRLGERKEDKEVTEL